MSYVFTAIGFFIIGAVCGIAALYGWFQLYFGQRGGG